jgi:hypothetical protein
MTEEHLEGEPCCCPECEAESNRQMAIHFREFRLYSINGLDSRDKENQEAINAYMDELRLLKR